jgi:hypothetical protein
VVGIVSALSPSLIDKLRLLRVRLAMPDTFEVRGPGTPVSDNAGGSTSTPVIVASGPCYVRALQGGDEQAVADRLGYTAAYAVDLPIELVVSTTDDLVINGRTVEIGGIVNRAGIARWSTVQTAICREEG